MKWTLLSVILLAIAALVLFGEHGLDWFFGYLARLSPNAP